MPHVPEQRSDPITPLSARSGTHGCPWGVLPEGGPQFVRDAWLRSSAGNVDDNRLHREIGVYVEQNKLAEAFIRRFEHAKAP
jgi:hypothetical protein